MDRLVLYLEKSVAKELEDNVSGLDDAYVMTPGFDFNFKSNPSNPSKRIPRILPYVTIELDEDECKPFTMGNILYDHDITLNIWVYGDSYSNLVNVTADTKQVLRNAIGPLPGEVGVTLYDFSVPSGVFYATAGSVEIIDYGMSTYYGPIDDRSQPQDERWDELASVKHRSVTPTIFSAFKDKDAVLLENLGNVRFND